MVTICTAPTSYTGKDLLNISRQHGCDLGRVFAPSWEILRPVIEERARNGLGVLVWERYRDKYIAEQRLAYHRDRWAFERVLAMSRVIAVCSPSCADPERCHRTLWARDGMARLGAVYAGEWKPQLSLL